MYTVKENEAKAKIIIFPDPVSSERGNGEMIMAIFVKLDELETRLKLLEDARP